MDGASDLGSVDGSVRAYGHGGRPGMMEEEKLPNISKTRIGDIDKSSIDNANSNFDQSSMDDEAYGAIKDVIGHGGGLYTDENYKGGSRNDYRDNANSFQEIAGYDMGSGGNQANTHIRV